MKLWYYLKNLNITNQTRNFLNQKLSKLKKFLGKSDQTALVEIELEKEKNRLDRAEPYRFEAQVDLPEKNVIRAEGKGKNIYQAINRGVKNLKFRLSQARKKNRPPRGET